MKSHTTLVAVAALAVAAITGTTVGLRRHTVAKRPIDPSLKGASDARLQQRSRELQSDATWESAESAAYATCMTQHGQQP